MTKINYRFATLSVIWFGLSVRFSMLTALLLIGLANVASAGDISLGSASDFTVLELGEKALSINSNSLIYGNVGKKKGGDKFLMSSSTITGQVYGDSNLSLDVSNSGGTNVNTGDTATLRQRLPVTPASTLRASSALRIPITIRPMTHS